MNWMGGVNSKPTPGQEGLEQPCPRHSLGHTKLYFSFLFVPSRADFVARLGRTEPGVRKKLDVVWKSYFRGCQPSDVHVLVISVGTG